MGLAAANAVAGLSGTFVVNGSPTKTAVVGAAGGRTQVAQLTTAGVTLVTLLVATGLIARLPLAALAALVFLIGARLIDLRSLRRIAHFRRVTFTVALATLLAVVILGVERGIFVAIGLSILDHLRQEYHPKDAVLTIVEEHVHSRAATPGAETAPGLLVYCFAAPLFFANADYFAARLQGLVAGAPHPVRWLVLDLAATDDIDYTAGLIPAAMLGRLQASGVTVALAEAEEVRGALDRLGITRQVGTARIFASVGAAIGAFREAVPGHDPAPAGVS